MAKRIYTTPKGDRAWISGPYKIKQATGKDGAKVSDHRAAAVEVVRSKRLLM